jgi:hypothetical protein
MPVAHACNPSYSGGSDQEDHGLRPVWGSSSQDPISKKGWWSGSSGRATAYEALSSNPSTAKKKRILP